MRPAHRSSCTAAVSPSSGTRDAQWPFAYIIAVHRNPVFDNTRWYARTRVSSNGSPSLKRRQKSRATHNLRRGSWDRDAKGCVHTQSEYVWDSDHGLCPAMTTTTVRRFPLGMTIDDRGLRASDFFLVSFFFFLSLFFIFSAVATGPVGTKTWSGESSSTLGSSCTTSSSRVQKRERDGGWTDVNRLNLPTPYRHVLRAMRDF